MWQQDSVSFATQIVFRICGPSIPSYTLLIPKKATQCSHENDGAPRSRGSKIGPRKHNRILCKMISGNESNIEVS
jgi:hypothetical protein